MSGWRILVAGPADGHARVALRHALWPEASLAASAAVLAAEPARDGLVLLARADDGAAIGLAEAAVRHDPVNGCNCSPVLFLEGLFVVPAWRRRGIARALVDAVADWGRARSLAEYASDADLANPAAHALHRALGFAETERVLFFRRGLPA